MRVFLQRENASNSGRTTNPFYIRNLRFCVKTLLNQECMLCGQPISIYIYIYYIRGKLEKKLLGMVLVHYFSTRA